MGARALERTQALVVRLADSGEADRIVGLYTRAHGLESAIAKSARRSTKRFGGALQTGQRLEVELVRAGSGLPRLESARIVDAHLGLLLDLARLEEASVVLRALRDLVPEGEPDPALFDDAVGHLAALAAEGADPCRLVGFRLRLVDRLGVGPELDRCVRCGRDAGEKSAYVDARLGGLVCRACGGSGLLLSAPARALAASIRDESDPPAAGESRDAAVDELVRLLDALVQHHLASRGGSRGTGHRFEMS